MPPFGESPDLLTPRRFARDFNGFVRDYISHVFFGFGCQVMVVEEVHPVLRGLVKD